MIGIYNTDDVPLSSLNLGLAEQSENPFTLDIDCRSGYVFRASNVSGITVNARFVGVGTFQDIGVTPLNLSAFPNQRKRIELQLVTPDVSAVIAGEFMFEITPQ